MSTAFYFNKKDERRAAAIAHTQDMAEFFAPLIKESITATKVYNDKVAINRNLHPALIEHPIITIQTMDSVSSIVSQVTQNPYHKVAVLNFASYKHPGGMFLAGSSAQEESLCHASYLYNVLDHFDGTYYEWNKNHLNNALYLNRGLYTPNIMFKLNDNTVYADVITVAAPNKGTALRYGHVDRHDNLTALKSRIDFVVDIAEDNGVDILILGAFGCGVFQQDPNEVAHLFQERCSKPSNVRQYIFAIPPDGVNYPTFKRILS